MQIYLWEQDIQNRNRMSRKMQLTGASTRSRLRRPGRRVSLQYPTDSVDNISEVSGSLGDEADTDEENDCNEDL